jgi:hypothetical protein
VRAIEQTNLQQAKRTESYILTLFSHFVTHLESPKFNESTVNPTGYGHSTKC